MVLHVKTNFTSGQISKELYGRGELSLYENGAKTLNNVTIAPTGGVSRRLGTKFVAEFDKKAKLISFDFNEEQTYLLAFFDGELLIFKDEVYITRLQSPFKEEHLDKLNYTQSADTLLIVHQDVEPQQVTRNTGEIWKIEPWDFYTKDGFVYCPYFNFFNKSQKLTPSTTTGYCTLSATSSLFVAAHVGSRIRINDGEVLIKEVVSSKIVKGDVTNSLSSLNSSVEWSESALSNARGWPRSVTFHQGRTVIGGSKSLPNRLWLSVSSDLFNFDLGTGLDDEAIEFAILSDKINAIENVVSTRHLLVFTSGGEWMVTGEPLTPISMSLSQQTQVGSYVHAAMMPQNIDGASIFVSANGRQLREFLFSDVEQAYQGKDLCLMAPDIMQKPIDYAFDKHNSVLYVVLENGGVSCYTSYRTEAVSGWSKLVTNGLYASVAVVGEDVYFCIKRGDKYYIEKQDNNFFTDCSFANEYADMQTKIAINPIFEGKEIRVLADGYDVGTYEVFGGFINLIYGAKSVKYGFEYEHVIEPLPLTIDGNRVSSPKSYRLTDSQFRIINSKTLRLLYNGKYVEVPLSKLDKQRLLDIPLDCYSGDVEIKSLGWIRDLKKTMWSIHGVEPYAFTLLSVINNIKTATKGG